MSGGAIRITRPCPKAKCCQFDKIAPGVCFLLMPNNLSLRTAHRWLFVIAGMPMGLRQLLLEFRGLTKRFAVCLTTPSARLEADWIAPPFS